VDFTSIHMTLWWRVNQPLNQRGKPRNSQLCHQLCKAWLISHV
jgi:hypothetical protein